MSPKKSTTKKKPSKKTPPVEKPPSTEVSKDELKQQIARLQEELVKVQFEKTHFKQEMETTKIFWETTKSNVEEVKANLRSRQKDKHNTEEQHRVEKSMYKQKLNNVLREHCDIISQLKTEGTASVSLMHKEHVKSELELLKEFNELKVVLRKKGLTSYQHIKDERLKHEMELAQLRKDYDERVRESEAAFRMKGNLVIEQHSIKKASMIEETERRMNKRVADLLTIHDKAFKDATEEFNSSERSRKRHIFEMKTTTEILTGKINQLDKDIKVALRDKERQCQSQHESEKLLLNLRTQLDDYTKVKAELEKVRARTKVVKQEREDLSVKHQLLRTAFLKAQKERDDMRKKQAEATEDIKLKICVENLLKSKTKAPPETPETKEAQLLSTRLRPVQSPTQINQLETKKAAEEAVACGSAMHCDDKGSSSTEEKEL